MNDIAEELNLPLKKVRMIRRAVKAYQTPSQSRDGTDLSSMGDILTDGRVGTPQERMLAGEELSILKRLMDCISDREATILRMRYGLDGSEVYTLAQISETLGISRERVRQVADEALTKLNQRLTTGRWPEASMRERDEERALLKASTGQ
jgi:RNA polymerase primary sigma factor